MSDNVDTSGRRVIKCGLSSILPKHARQPFIYAVERYVIFISRGLRDASLTFAIDGLCCLENNRELPDAYAQNQTFFKHLIRKSQPDDATKGLPEIDQVIGYASTNFRTMVANNAWVPLWKRLERLMKAEVRAKDVKTSTYKVMRAIRGAAMDVTDVDDAMVPLIKDIRRRLRVRLPPTHDKPLYDDHAYACMTLQQAMHFNFWMQKRFNALEQRMMHLFPVY